MIIQYNILYHIVTFQFRNLQIVILWDASKQTTSIRSSHQENPSYLVRLTSYRLVDSPYNSP